MMRRAIGAGLIVLGVWVLVTSRYLFPLPIRKIYTGETSSINAKAPVDWLLHGAVIMVLVGTITLLLSRKRLMNEYDEVPD